MKHVLTALLFIASVMLCSSCQKELPDSITNIDVNKGGQTPTPTPTPTPDNPTQQGDVPTEDDNPWPGY